MPRSRAAGCGIDQFGVAHRLEQGVVRRSGTGRCRVPWVASKAPRSEQGSGTWSRVLPEEGVRAEADHAPRPRRLRRPRAFGETQRGDQTSGVLPRVSFTDCGWSSDRDGASAGARGREDRRPRRAPRTVASRSWAKRRPRNRPSTPSPRRWVSRPGPPSRRRCDAAGALGSASSAPRRARVAVAMCSSQGAGSGAPMAHTGSYATMTGAGRHVLEVGGEAARRSPAPQRVGRGARPRRRTAPG